MAGIEDFRLPGVAQDVVDGVLTDWGSYLLEEKGLACSTVAYYERFGRPLLEELVVDEHLDLARLCAADVNFFLQKTLPRVSAGTGKVLLSVMRSLLHFLYVTGSTPRNLSGVVLASSGFRDAGLPRWLPLGDVSRMVSSCDVATVSGRRSRAILTIISRLGLRAGEVCRLTLDDLDWRSGTLRVVGKGGYVDVMPLPVDVGEVLEEYLVSAPMRPVGERALFLRLNAPVGPMTRDTAGWVVRSAGVRAGLGPIGSHRLRHTVATATVNAGAALEEVGQLLRHRSLDSTTIYAKVDVTHLVLLARPWPKLAPVPEHGDGL